MGVRSITQLRKATIILLIATTIASFFFIYTMALYYTQVYEAIFGMGVAVSSISLRELNSNNATVEVALRVDNPSSMDVSLNRIEYQLYLNKRYLGGVNLQRRRMVSSNSSIPILSEVAVGSNRIEVVLEANQADKWRWRVDGSLHLKNPLRNTVLIPFVIKYP